VARKHDRARERDSFQTRGPGLAASGPDWAGLPGHDIRTVGGQKVYRCPGCDHEIRAGVQHLVIVPTDDPDERRHWHTECWRRELRRLGYA